MSMSYTTGRLHTITGGRQASDTSDVALLRSISAPSPALAGLASGGLGPGEPHNLCPPVTYVTGDLAGSAVLFDP